MSSEFLEDLTTNRRAPHRIENLSITVHDRVRQIVHCHTRLAMNEKGIENLIAGQESGSREFALRFLLASGLPLAYLLAPNFLKSVDEPVIRKLLSEIECTGLVNVLNRFLAPLVLKSISMSGGSCRSS